MSKDERNKWEARYSHDEQEFRQPSPLLVKWIGEAPPGKALDLAAGMGRNAFFLAERGYEVTAVDLSPTAIRRARKQARKKSLPIEWIEADLDSYTLPGRYDLIVISFFYINKKLAPAIMEALNAGGVLIYENHMLPPQHPEEAAEHSFHFQPGELRALFPGLKLLHYEERQAGEKGGHPSWVAALVARKEGQII